MTSERQGRGWPEPLDLGGVRSRPLRECDHKVHLRDFGRPVRPEDPAGDLLDSLPRILAGDRLRALAREIASARRSDRPVILALGGHVAKVGVTPLIIDWMERGAVTAVAANGALAIHDAEIAMVGSTSERVEDVLPDGRFGMASETADLFARAAREASSRGTGLGRCLGEAIADAPHASSSVLASAVRIGIPITVHVALGTDTVQMHPAVSGADLGAASMMDFRILAAASRRLGVWVNVGSAVILPEVFLKVIGVLRNIGEAADDITAADIDFVRHYRPEVNVMRRPAARGIALTGHHEIILPLLGLAIAREMGFAGGQPK